VEKVNDVNISRYGNGSLRSKGRCDGTGLAECFGFGGGMDRLENGRNEHRRLEIGAGCSSCVSTSLMFLMNLLW
jgi:hypothetical protein